MPRVITQCGRAKAGRRGAVIVAVLVVVTILALVGYQYNDRMTREHTASTTALRAAQAKASADSGVHYVAALLSNPDNRSKVLNDNPYDNADAFRGRTVGAAGGRSNYFSVFGPTDPEGGGGEGGLRFGVVDECGKINLNALLKLDRRGRRAAEMLLKLPDMTEEIAHSILDWIDPDSEPRMGGAESDHYSSLDPPYRAKNGPLESLEELLLVKGVTPELLFGRDRNRNGVVDPDEADGGTGSDLGWSAFLTVYSRELNVDAQGQPLVDVNGEDLSKLYDELAAKVGEELAKYVILYRVHGSGSSPRMTAQAVAVFLDTTGAQMAIASQTSRDPNRQSWTERVAVDLSGAVRALSGQKGPSPKEKERPKVNGSLADLTLDSLTKEKAKQKVGSFFDLINSEVTVKGKDDKSPDVIYTSPLKDEGRRRELLPKLFAGATTKKERELPARINVNTAPREVLLAIPNLSEADAETLLSKRPPPSSPDAAGEVYQTPAWLVTEAGLKPEAVKRIENFVTTRAQVFRVQSLGYSDGRGPSARVEAVIDTNAGRPRVLYWRDLTELGKGAEADLAAAPQ